MSSLTRKAFPTPRQSTTSFSRAWLMERSANSALNFQKTMRNFTWTSTSDPTTLLTKRSQKTNTSQMRMWLQRSTGLPSPRTTNSRGRSAASWLRTSSNRSTSGPCPFTLASCMSSARPQSTSGSRTPPWNRSSSDFSRTNPNSQNPISPRRSSHHSARPDSR